MKKERGFASTGIPGLDNVLNGGLPKNRFYLVEGTPGTGKTTLALQFLLAGAARGERTMYITLSETHEELLEVADSHGWSIEKLSIFELSAIEQELEHETQNTLFHPSEVELTQTTRILTEQTEKIRPARLVLDSLSELRLLSQNALRFRRQLLGLKQFFAQRQCTVLFLDDLTSNNTDLQVESIAHGVIALEHLPNEYGADRRRLRVRKLRSVAFRSGYHDYSIRTGGLEVFPRLVAADDRSKHEVRAVKSGIAGLDALLGDGLHQGTSTLIMGPSGTGKSTLAMHYALAEAKIGNASVVFTFDETIAVGRARAESLGLEIGPHLASGIMKLVQVDPAELSPGEFIEQIKAAVEKQDVRLIVIDSLNGYLNAMPGERHLVLQLHELLTYLNQRGVLTLMVFAQHGMHGNMKNSIDLTYLSDTVVLLRHFEMRGSIKKAISVVKKRTGRHEDTLRELKIENGIRIGEVLSDFEGVLSGIPQFVGDASRIMKEEDAGSRKH